jgi:MoxR-like ATPase
VFAQLLMADEINRASPRTQSALLQAMQEGHVTVAGQRYDLPKPFPRARDAEPARAGRHLSACPRRSSTASCCEVDVHYPDREAERRILVETTGAAEAEPRAVLTADELSRFQRLVRRLPVGESVVEAILDLVRSARPEESAEIADLVAWGPGPRASQALMLSVRARALLQGRFAPSIDDVVALAEPVLQHRMALTFAARADGETIDSVITRLKTRLS